VWKKVTRGGRANNASAGAERKRTAMEYKILNTLWTEQVNQFPDLQIQFTFRLNVGAREFLEFREAGNRLLGEGLISETDTGQFYLTQQGIQYCAKHYQEFPADRWFGTQQIDPQKLEKVLREVRN